VADPHESGPPSVPREPDRVDGAGTGNDGDSAGGVNRGYADWPPPGEPLGGTTPAYGGWEPRERRRSLLRPRRNPVPPAEPSRLALGLELLVIFLLSFAVPAFSLAAPQGPAPPPDMFALAVLAGAAFQWLPIGVLYFFFVRRRGGWFSIGLTRIDQVDLAAGLLLWVVSHFTVIFLGILTRGIGLGSNDVEFLPAGLPIWSLAGLSIVIAVTAGLVEEILVRGYAQTRLEQLRVPTALIVVVPTALWAVLHIYQGAGPALVIFGLGLVYALWFQRSRRLWPVIIAHVMFDLTTLVYYILYISSR
jgi:membrane protease YdiL (CAAX protease family)